MRNVPGPEGLTSRGPEQIAFEKGQEVAKLYEGIWEQLPPMLRGHLVDSNVALTVGGLKPMTEFFPAVPEDSDVQNLRLGVDRLNKMLEQQGVGVRFFIVGEPFSPRNNLGLPRSQMVGVESLAGYERISRQSRMPGIEPFNQSGGFAALEKWRGNFYWNLKKAQEEGQLPKELDLDNISAGIQRGYPDIAIIDFSQYISEGRKRPIAEMHIPYTGTYEEAEPNYTVFPEHADHPDVLANARELGALLQGFYESDFHQKVSQEPEIAARKAKPDLPS